MHNRMASSSSSVATSAVSMSSSASAVSGSSAAVQAKLLAEEERTLLIRKWLLSPTMQLKRKRDAVWKKPYYFVSKHSDHKDDVFCMKCKKWIQGGIYTHVKQHDDRWHLDIDDDETGSSGGSKKVQAKVNQVYKMPSDARARLNAYLVGEYTCLLYGESGEPSRMNT